VSIAVATNDRFGVSLVGSTLVHVFILLGIGFAWPKLKKFDGLPTLEITLVQTASDKAPLKPEFLAQVNQDGGGDSDKAKIASTPFPVREIGDQKRDALSVLSTPQPPIRGRAETRQTLSGQDARKLPNQKTEPQKRQASPEPLRLGLLEQSANAERAKLNAEISRNWEEFQKAPRKKFLNARTQEYKYAAYMDAWRAKVERVGNLNYPEEAKRRQIVGSLVLDVVLKVDGSVAQVRVARASGHKLLDDAAVRIVELASPFNPFPKEMRAEVDEVVITRTWKFNDALSTN
jgi:protein TonB